MKIWLVIDLVDQKRYYQLNGDDPQATFDDFSTDWSESVPLYYFNYKKKKYEKVFFYTEAEREFAQEGVNSIQKAEPLCARFGSQNL